MMKHEFEELAGYEVTFEDYNNIIEPMYMATNLNKIDFVKCIDKKRFALKPVKSLKKLIKEMSEIAEHLKETCDHYTDWEAKEKLDNLLDEYKNRIGAYGYHVNQKFTYEHLGAGRGCVYPSSVEYYNCNYNTVAIIELLN